MIHTIWTAIFYRPLYNLLLGIIIIMPGADVGLAVIVLTVLVKLVLFPLTQRSIYSQIEMKALEPEINEIKEKYKDDKTEQNKRTYALYKEKKVNPFSSCLLILIQLPVIIALYWVFLHGFATLAVPPYSFVHAPSTFNLNFLGFVNLAQKSIVLALIAGITQYIQGRLAQGRQAAPAGDSMGGQFAKTMQTQMLYVLPVMIVLIAYRISAAVALYWITSNIFTIGQELYTRHKMKQAKLIV